MLDHHTYFARRLEQLGVPDWRAQAVPHVLELPSLSRVQPQTAKQIDTALTACGLVVLDIADQDVDPERARTFARTIGLGEPHTPAQYRNSTHVQNGVSEMRARENGAAHPSFTTTAGQLLHSDGTLEPIGSIRTTILGCRGQAASGGETFFFNITQALCEIYQNNPDIAEVLLSEGILVRTANMAGVAGSHQGPAFAFRHDELISRASFSSTDAWAIPGDHRGYRLAAGIAMLLERAVAESDLFVKIRLEPGQIALFSNDKLAHGREPYINSAAEQRDVYRLLFATRPGEEECLTAP